MLRNAHVEPLLTRYWIAKVILLPLERKIAVIVSPALRSRGAPKVALESPFAARYRLEAAHAP